MPWNNSTSLLPFTTQHDGKSWNVSTTLLSLTTRTAGSPRNISTTLQKSTTKTDESSRSVSATLLPLTTRPAEKIATPPLPQNMPPQNNPHPGTSSGNSGNSRNPGSPSIQAGNTQFCGPIEPYQQPNASSWALANTDEWFNAWWTNSSGKFDPTYGFAETFGYMYTGNPNYNCADNGADDNCQIDPCGNAVLSSAGSSMEPAYYVLESMTHLRQYFKALEISFVTAGIQAALVKDNWAYTYYVDKDDFSTTAISILLIAVVTVINIVAALAGPAGWVAVAANAAAAAAGGMIFMDRIVATQQKADDTPKKAAQIGSTLASIFQQGMASFTQANNVLMKGLPYGTEDIRGYISGGAYLTGPNPNTTAITQTANTLLASAAINQLWKQQKIFIMGGGPCDDSGGIGQGPQEAKLCKNNQAWYLFYWQEYLGGIHLGKKQWGNVAAPPGMDTLASEGLTIQDVIAASLDAYSAGGNNYSAEFRQNRTLEAIQSAGTNPSVFLPSFEGNFNIPVCDVSPVVPISGKVFNKKDVILQPYGAKKVPQWCSPVCRGPDGSLDLQTMKDFINAANMHGFQSFQSYCPHGHWLWDGKD